MTRHKDRLSVLCRKGLASLGGSGLEKERRTLGRWLTDMWARDGIVFPLVVDFADKRRVGVYSAATIANDSVVAPGRFEELVHHADVFLCDCVSASPLVSSVS